VNQLGIGTSGVVAVIPVAPGNGGCVDLPSRVKVTAPFWEPDKEKLDQGREYPLMLENR
jgi:hypothetical protein